MKNKIRFCFATFLMIVITNFSYSQQNKPMTFEEYIRSGIPAKKEIDVFINEFSWAKFDPDLGYILGNYMPYDGIDKSSTISTALANGARKSFMYAAKPCRINAYGNSFTQCHQVSDGETWEEYLGANLGEPVRNFGMGGYGVNQTYQRMLKQEKTKDSGQYIRFYFWGDDHIRSLLRCRYMLIQSWIKDQQSKEGVGKMFHGNFWPNIEMNLATGKLEEHKSRITRKEDLYKMTDADWMYANLKDDLALQMGLYKEGLITDVDVNKLKKLASYLNFSVDLDDKTVRQASVSSLLDKYSFAATEFIVKKAKDFSAENNKKLMVILFDPYRVTKALIRNEKRYDQQVVNFLKENDFNYFDINLVHQQDFKKFNLSIDDYFKRYFIGHYSPAGNHFFAYSIKPKIIEWLQPKPITYENTNKQMTDFKGYVEAY